LVHLHGKELSSGRPQQSSGEDVAVLSNDRAEMDVETLDLEEVTGCILWTRGAGKLWYT